MQIRFNLVASFKPFRLSIAWPQKRSSHEAAMQRPESLQPEAKYKPYGVLVMALRKRVLERERDRETERQRDRETERDRERHRQTDRQTDRERVRQREHLENPFIHVPSDYFGLS